MKKAADNPVISNLIRLAAIAVVIISMGIAFIYFRADAKTFLLMLLFILFYVLLPGMGIVSRLDLRGDHTSTYLARSFFAGFAAEIAVYFISDLLSSDILLWIAGPAMSIAFIAGSIMKNGKRDLLSVAAAVKNAPASFYVFVMTAFLCSMFTTQYTYFSPAHAAYSYMRSDFSFHAGIINALSGGFPPLDPWISGRTIEYHLFTEMLYSIPVRLMGIHSDEILMACTPYVITPVFTVALYSFYREFSSRPERAGLYCLATHFSNMFMVKQWASSWFLFHIYSNINNAGMGLSCMLVILPLLKIWDGKSGPGEERINTKNMFFLGVLVMLTTGIKGPIAIVLVAGIIGTMILGAILKKTSKGMAAAGGMSVIAFILVYVYILGAQHSNETGGRLINLWEVTDIFFIKEETMDAVPGPRIAGYVVLLAVFMIFYLTAFFLPFIIGYIREFVQVITKKKPFVFSRVVIYAACMVGIAAMLVLDFAGHSQVYFGFAASILVPVIAFWFFEDTECIETKKWVRAVKYAFCACFCVTVLTSCIYLHERVLISKETYDLRDNNINPYRNISAKEYEGMDWLRNNTPADALIASDRYSSTAIEEYDASSREDNTHFAYAVYSNRRQYMEGGGFSLEEKDSPLRQEMVIKNNALYDPENKTRGELAKELGIDYLVFSKRFFEPVDLSGSGFEKVFSNEEVDIYRFTEQ